MVSCNKPYLYQLYYHYLCFFLPHFLVYTFSFACWSCSVLLPFAPFSGLEPSPFAGRRGLFRINSFAHQSFGKIHFDVEQQLIGKNRHPGQRLSNFCRSIVQWQMRKISNDVRFLIQSWKEYDKGVFLLVTEGQITDSDWLKLRYSWISKKVGEYLCYSQRSPSAYMRAEQPSYITIW